MIDLLLSHSAAVVGVGVCFVKGAQEQAVALLYSWWMQQIDRMMELEGPANVPLIVLRLALPLTKAKVHEGASSESPTLPLHLHSW